MVEVIREQLPCGESITTIERDENGAIIRQDCEIRVSAEAMKSLAGEF